MLLGLAFMVAGPIAVEETGWLPIGLVGFGFAMVAVGGLAFRHGQQQAALRTRRLANAMPLEALRREVEQRPLGFSVCNGCSIVIPDNTFGICPECGSPSKCIAVANEQDRKLALAAISPP